MLDASWRRPVNGGTRLEFRDDFSRAAADNRERSREREAVVGLRPQPISYRHPPQFRAAGFAVESDPQVHHDQSPCSSVEECKWKAKSQLCSRSPEGVCARVRRRDRPSACVQPPKRTDGENKRHHCDRDRRIVQDPQRVAPAHEGGIGHRSGVCRTRGTLPLKEYFDHLHTQACSLPRRLCSY